jgi:hypothetical protein
VIVRDHGDAGRWYVVAYEYATAKLAKRAWERAMRRLNLNAGDEGIGIIRLSPSPPGGMPSGTRLPAVVCVTLDEPTAEKADRLLSVGGDPFTPVDGFADAIILRRLRVLQTHQGQTGRMIIRRPEKRGMELDREGHLRPHERGQG